MVARHRAATLPSAAMRPHHLSPSARLGPVRRLPLPRRGTLLRLAGVASLLVTAAALAYGGDPPPAAPAPPTASPTAPGAPATGDGPAADAVRLPVPAELVGVPVPLGDPTALAVLRPGDRVDLFSVPPSGGRPVPLAEGALVLAVDAAAATLFVALTPAQAHEVIAVPGAMRFALLVRPEAADTP